MIRMRAAWAVFLALGLAASLAGARAQGFAARLPICLGCHGEGGQSSTEKVPSLGGQPSPYVVIQLYMFREKLRRVVPMNDMAAGLSDADLQNFADTIAKLPPPKPAEAPDPARAAHARALAEANRCTFCHNNFAGGDAVPRLAAQREDYLLKALREYKAGARKEYQPVMAEVVAKLSENDLADLAHYLARLAVP